MTEHSADTLWALLLTNRLTTVDAKPYSAGEFWKLVDSLATTGEPVIGSADEIVARAGMSPDDAQRVRTLLDAGRAFGFERERLEDGGLEIVAALDARFPARLRDRLGRSCPPFLVVAGDLQRLSAGGLSVAGSRDASDEALDVTRDAARAAVARGWQVITGLAKGVDQVAIDAASDAGGDTVGIPAEGVNVVSRRPHVRRLVHSGRLCIASPYGPDARFTAGTAMGRNKIIFALSTVGFVVSADKGSGGTWTGAVEALKRQWCPVAVWHGRGGRDGNVALVAQGGRAITVINDAFDVAEAATPSPRQTSLF
jgi:predicted Rossmann fold nucleotide-binding protein DprA/Smf involved in DNA uptake